MQFAQNARHFFLLLLLAVITANSGANAQTDQTQYVPIKGPPSPLEWQANPGLFLEGNWIVEWQGHPKFTTARVWMSKGLVHDIPCGTSGFYENCRDPNAALTSSGVRPGIPAIDGVIGPVGHSVYVLNAGRNNFQVRHGADTVSTLRRSGGSAQLIEGTWTNNDGEAGKETWRRAASTVARVECRRGGTEGVKNANGICAVTVPSYPGKSAVRGNLPSVAIDVFGANLYGVGPLPVFIDTQGLKLEIGAFCYLFDNPSHQGPGYGCYSWGAPGGGYGEIIGVRAVINVAYGATPGLKEFTIGGQKVSFELLLPTLPDELAVKEKVNLYANGNLPVESLRDPFTSRLPATSTTKIFHIGNSGEATASNISILISSKKSLCPYDAGCEGQTDGLLDRTSICTSSWTNGGVEESCTPCQLQSVNTQGDFNAQINCPGSRIVRGDGVRVNIAFDPKPKTGVAPDITDHDACLAAPLLDIFVKADEEDTDESDNHTKIALEIGRPKIEALRFLRARDDKMSPDTASSVTEIFAGEEVIIEARLNKPLCEHDLTPGETSFETNGLKEATALVGVKVSEELLATRDIGHLDNIALAAVQSSDHYFRSAAINPAIYYTSVTKIGDPFTASMGDQSSALTIKPYAGKSELTLTALDDFDRLLPDRQIRSDGQIRIDFKFVDGKGPTPDHDSIDVSFDGLYVVNSDNYHLQTSQNLVLNKIAPGHYQLDWRNRLELRGGTVDAHWKTFSVDHLYARPFYDGRERLNVVAPGLEATLKLVPAEDAAKALAPGRDVEIGSRVRFELDGQNDIDLPVSYKIDVAARDRTGKIRNLTTQFEIIPDVDSAVDGTPYVAYSDSFILGPGGPFPNLKPGEKIKGRVVGHGRNSAWYDIAGSKAVARSIEILPNGSARDKTANIIRIGETFQVKLTYDADNAPGASVLRARLIRETKGRAAAESAVLLTAEKETPHIYLSNVRSAVPDAFYGKLEPGDVIKAVFEPQSANLIDKKAAGIEGRAYVDAPEPVVRSLVLDTGAGGGARDITTDGVFKANVIFETPPFDGPGLIELRVVRNGAPITNAAAELSWENYLDDIAASDAMTMGSGSPLGRLEAGDRIEARYGDGAWAPMPTAALNVTGAAGKVSKISFFVDGEVVSEFTADDMPIIEVEFEAPPKGRAGGVKLTTDSNFSDPFFDGDRNQSRVMSLSAVRGAPVRFRTRALKLEGAVQSTAKRSLGGYPDFRVIPGYRIEASISGVTAEVEIAAPDAKSGEATLTVNAFDVAGRMARVRIVAENNNTGREYNFVPGASINLEAGTYAIDVKYPVPYKTALTLTAGDEQVHDIPKPDIGGLRVDMRDGANKRRTPGHIYAWLKSGGPKGWSDSGVASRANEIILPRGTYDIDVGIGEKSDRRFSNIQISGGQTTDLSIGHRQGKLKVGLVDADNAPMSKEFTVSGAEGVTSGAFSDVPSGLQDVIVNSPFKPVIKDLNIIAAKENTTSLKLGRLDIIGFSGASAKPAKVGVVVERLDKIGAQEKSWSGYSEKVDVPAGNYRVTFSDVKETQAVSVAAGQTVPVTQQHGKGRVVLKPGPGMASKVSANSHGYYFIIRQNGKQIKSYRSNHSFDFDPVDLEPGLYEFQLIDARIWGPETPFAMTQEIKSRMKNTVVIDNYGSAAISVPASTVKRRQRDLEIRKLGDKQFRLIRRLYYPAQKTADTFHLPPGKYQLRRNGYKEGVTWQKTIDIVKGQATPVILPD